MLTILVDSHLYGNKIHQEAFRVYLENLHEICNFYVLMTSCVSSGVMFAYSDGMVELSPDINWVFLTYQKKKKTLTGLGEIQEDRKPGLGLSRTG